MRFVKDYSFSLAIALNFIAYAELLRQWFGVAQ